MTLNDEMARGQFDSVLQRRKCIVFTQWGVAYLIQKGTQVIKGYPTTP